MNSTTELTKEMVSNERLNSERQQYRAEGIIFAANRLLAAWDAGFIDKPAADTLDVATMILSALDMLPDATEGDYQRGFADEMLKFLREEAKKGPEPVPPVPALSPDVEYLAEEAECIAMNLDDRGVPKTAGNESLSLWGRVVAYRNMKSQPVSAVSDIQLSGNSEQLANSPVIPADRDEYGFWQHPDRMETPFDETGATEIEWSTYFSERGMEVQHLYMNQFFCGDCVHDEKDIHPALYWNPTPPAGAGWVLMAIFDTEEGPCSEWVRQIPHSEGGNRG